MSREKLKSLILINYCILMINYVHTNTLLYSKYIEIRVQWTIYNSPLNSYLYVHWILEFK